MVKSDYMKEYAPQPRRTTPLSTGEKVKNATTTTLRIVIQIAWYFALGSGIMFILNAIK